MNFIDDMFKGGTNQKQWQISKLTLHTLHTFFIKEKFIKYYLFLC